MEWIDCSVCVCVCVLLNMQWVSGVYQQCVVVGRLIYCVYSAQWFRIIPCTSSAAHGCCLAFRQQPQASDFTRLCHVSAERLFLLFCLLILLFHAIFLPFFAGLFSHTWPLISDTLLCPAWLSWQSRPVRGIVVLWEICDKEDDFAAPYPIPPLQSVQVKLP